MSALFRQHAYVSVLSEGQTVTTAIVLLAMVLASVVICHVFFWPTDADDDTAA